ncbi:MAG: hypothetical protein PHY12_05040 [Eubacteriales bacterium]|nr:hypothetical protein [Eubacteriales bacterium]
MQSASPTQRAGFVAALCCFLFALTTALYFVIGPANAEFHADCADTLAWAEASADAGALVNPDFSYACLLPFGGQLLMQPFIPLFGVSMTTHILGMALFTLLLAGAALWLMRACGHGWSAAFLSSAALLLCLLVSFKLREIFYNHVIYYSLGALFLMAGLALALHAERACGRKKLRWCLLLGGWSLLCATDGLMALALFSVPLIAGLLLERLLSHDSLRSPSAWLPAACVVIGSLAGCAVGALLRGDVTTAYADGFSGFSAPETWSDHLRLLLTHWTSLLGVEAVDGLAFQSADGLRQLALLFFALTLAALPLLALLCYRRLSRPTRILVLSHWTLTLILLAGFVFGQLSVANWRLSPLVASSLLVSACWACDMLKGVSLPCRRLGALGAAFLLAMSGVSAAHVYALPLASAASQAQDALIADLEAHDLSYGYCLYFQQCGPVTVRSSGKVKLRQVDVVDDMLAPATFQVNSRWYEDQPGQETYFFLIATELIGDYEHLIPYDYTDSFESGSYTVYVCDYNFMNE